MSISVRAQDALFAGNKGLHLTTSATLSVRLAQYSALAGDTSTPPALRDYSATTATEIRAELTRRAPLMEAA